MLPAPARWGLLVLVVGLLFWASVATQGVVYRPQASFPLTTALLHVAGYAVLAGALVYAWLPDRARPLRRGLLVFALAAGYGLALELVQARVPGRTPDLVDAAANAIGAATAVAWDALIARFTATETEAGEGGPA